MIPVVVVNPNSGGGQTRRRWPEIEVAIREGLGDFRPLFTERPGHATALCREALRDGADCVIALGGDGTVNEVVNGFFEPPADGGAPIRREAVFGVLPSGTGGDFVKTIGTPRRLVDAARAIAEGRPRRIDAARLSYVDASGKPRQRCFINIASFGIGGLVDRYVNESSKALGGLASFLLATLRATWVYRNPRCRLLLDGRQASERTIYSVAVANGRYFGGGMEMAPEARLDDGLFDVVTIGDVGMATVVRHTPKIYRGAHLGLPWVTLERAARVDAEPVDRRDEVLIDMDGEQPGRLPATFELLPRAIAVAGVNDNNP